MIGIRLGALGTVDVRPGFYLYVGSAFGPGGVAARVSRHCRTGGVEHWHVDYLRAVTPVSEVWYTYDAIRREHQWVEKLIAMPGASVPKTGFGASDCTCAAHLVFFERPIGLARFRRVIRRAYLDHAPIRSWMPEVNSP
jgi:Uri superfamily endonuclease